MAVAYLADTDIRYCLTRLPKDLREIIINKQLILAGGMIRAKLREVDPNIVLEGIGAFDEHENIPVLP